MSLWKRLQAALVRLGIAGQVVVFIIFIIFIVFTIFIGVAYYTGVFPDPDWTGFGPPKVNADGQEVAHFKTLWDWLGLLLVPLVLAIGGFFLTRSENRYALQLQERREEEARKIEEQRILEAQKLEAERAQDAALQAYLEAMTQLLLHEALETSKPDDTVATVARARTLTVLRVLDGTRKATVLKFLYEARLIGGIKREEGGVPGTIEAIVSLEGANLREARLEWARLEGAHLEGARLGRANLKGAYLGGANLKGAYLGGANLDRAHLDRAHLDRAHLDGASLDGASLERAHLVGADLRWADLTNSKVTREQLAQAKSHEGAKLPFDMTSPPAPEVEGGAQEDQAKE
jgi:hypothetical protein